MNIGRIGPDEISVSGELVIIDAARASLALELTLLVAYYAYWSLTGGLMTVLMFFASMQLGSWTPTAAATHLGAMLFVAWDFTK